MQEVYRFSDILGLTPAIDPTRSTDQFVLNGQNYIFDAIGPKSAFGDRLLLPHKLENPEHVQGMRLKLRAQDRCFTVSAAGIMEWSETDGGWKWIFTTPDTSSAPYRWTWGYLAGIMYFCHPVTGIIFYDIENEYAARLEGPGVPTDPLAITICNGRLIAITPTLYMWSGQSDGSDFDPQLGGAGFQRIDSRVPGYPIMVTKYGRGTLTWTTGGVMRSEFTGDQEVFRHRELNTEYRMINSFCSFKADDDTIVILDERGLFQSKGEAPTPFAPLFNEFLIDYIKKNQLNLGQNVRLEWDELRRLLYVSVSLTRYDAIYEQAFVLYPPVDKWGQFNEPHYGILPFRVEDGERVGDYYGFVDSDYRCRIWQETGSRESFNTDLTVNLYYPPMQKPFEQQAGDDGLTVSSSGVANTFNDNQIEQIAGYYPSDGTTPMPPELTDLDAFVWLGLMRNSTDQSHDEASEIVQVLIRSNVSGPDERTASNFNLTPPEGPDDTDYNSDVATDYGVEDLNYVNHQGRIISTIDGTTEYQSSDLTLVGFSKAARHYSCSTVGIWHILEVKAENVGEAFYLRTVEITGVNAGRIL